MREKHLLVPCNHEDGPVQRVLRWVNQALQDALGLFLPVRCAGCGAWDHIVCPECVALIPQTPQFRELFIPATKQRIPLWYCCELEEPLSSVINAFKDSDMTVLARFLASLVAPTIQSAQKQFPAALWVTPPSSRKNYRARGYHPVRIIAQKARVRLSPLLTNYRNREDQSGLARGIRERNMHGVFIATRNLAGVQVVLCDDVLTTGSTLRECVRAISAAGGNVCAVVVLAYTPKKLSENFQEIHVTEEGVWD